MKHNILGAVMNILIERTCQNQVDTVGFRVISRRFVTMDDLMRIIL